MAQLTDNAILTFDEFKIGKADAGFLVLKLVAGGKIDVVEKGAKGATWEDAVKDTCLAAQPAWVFYHFGYETSAGKRSKLVMVQWIPGDSAIRDKMQYAMWTNTVKQSLNGIACTIQAGSLSNVEHDEVLQRAAKFERDALAAN